jgi:acyl transferase domain-containing protein
MSEIAITGIGAVFPGAPDAPAFWDNIRSGADAISDVPTDRWDPEIYCHPDAPPSGRFYCRRGGFVDDLADFDPAAFGIMPAAVEGTEPDQLLMLRAAAEALADAGPLHADPDRIGVIIGRGGYLTPGIARLDQQVHTVHQVTAILRDLVPDLPQERLAAITAAFTNQPADTLGLVPNFAASRLANRFDFRGPAYTVDAACASSLVAVDHAVQELTTGRCDVVLAGGVHVCHHPTLWAVFTRLRALSAGGVIRPFDTGADGTLLSEGTGAVLLKRLTDARRADDKIYAVIRGVGVASDGRATSMMNPRVEGQELAIRRAWAAAGLDPAAPGALDLLEAHGTATPVGDQAELTTLGRVFGPPEGPPIGIGTVKSMIGHAMPAAGIAGLIKAALALHEETLPPTLHLDEPHPALAATRFEPVTQSRPWNSRHTRRAAVSAFGFGGINTHVILEEPAPRSRSRPRPRPGTATRPEAILRLTAATPQALAARLDQNDQEPGDGPCRLAIVAPDPRKLALARKVLDRGTPWRGRSDLWFTPSPMLRGPEQVAFLFPGLEPGFTPGTEGVAEALALPEPSLTGDDTILGHALDMVAVSRLFAAALARLGIVPGALAGHSLGEWTAMIVGGVYPEIDEFIESMRPGMVELPDVVYLTLGTHAARATELIGALPELTVSHDNCPRQSVVCGPALQIADLAERARQAAILAQPLPFRSGFHSPRYAPHVAAARQRLGRLQVQTPAVPVWSATSVTEFPRDPDAVRDLVLRHLTEPVRFRQLTERLHDHGIRAFVQVGPGSLTGFAEDTLRDRDHLAVATATPQRDGLAQLRRTAAALWAEGLSPGFGQLTPPSTAVRLKLGTPVIRLTPATPATPKASTTVREFSLATMPELADHCLCPQPEGWPDPADMFPVVPMTTLLEVMADAALTLAPGQTVTGFDQVSAMRWLAVAPATTTNIHAERIAPDRIRVRIEGYATGTVLIAGTYPPPPAASTEPLREQAPAPVTARELYADGWMFHGRRFAGVADIGTLAADGITGTVTSLPAPGALLDSAGQLIGHWMQVSRTTDQTVLPTGIDAIRLFGPRPPDGGHLACTGWIRELTGAQLRADAELTGKDGRVWCRIEGWTTRRFATDDAIWQVKCHPGRHALSRSAPGGWTVLRERWPDTASRELIMRRYLNATERAQYHQLSPLDQRRWLLGRIAAKDAVRQLLWDRGAGPLYPAELTVYQAQDGIRVRGPFRAPAVSLACTRPGLPGPPCAVAVIADGPVSFTVDLDQDGTLLVTEPGRSPQPLSQTKGP